jgi:hypothetical protein
VDKKQKTTSGMFRGVRGPQSVCGPGTECGPGTDCGHSVPGPHTECGPLTRAMTSSSGDLKYCRNATEVYCGYRVFIFLKNSYFFFSYNPRTEDKNSLLIPPIAINTHTELENKGMLPAAC